jgi:hypothetical protein
MRFGPPISFARRRDGGNLAYQVVGEGDLDLVFLFGSHPTTLRDDDYPWGSSAEEREQLLAAIRDGTITGRAGDLLAAAAPRESTDASVQHWWRMYSHTAASPVELYDGIKSLGPVDIRGLLGSVHVPVLVLHRTGDRLADVHASRYMAQRLPNARLVELPGHDHFLFFGDQDTVIELTQEFLTGALPVADPDRILATVLFTDIVDSTRVAAELGDRRWHRVLEEHHQAVRRIWRDFVVARSRRPGMGSWPPLTARPEPSARPMPSGPSWPSTACRSGPACTPGNASCSTTTSGASRCTSPPVSWHRPVTGRSCAHGGQGPGRRGRLRVHQPWHPPAQRRAG